MSIFIITKVNNNTLGSFWTKKRLFQGHFEIFLLFPLPPNFLLWRGHYSLGKSQSLGIDISWESHPNNHAFKKLKKKRKSFIWDIFNPFTVTSMWILDKWSEIFQNVLGETNQKLLQQSLTTLLHNMVSALGAKLFACEQVISPTFWLGQNTVTKWCRAWKCST